MNSAARRRTLIVWTKRPWPVALIASSLEANDPAKAALVAQADRLQGLKGQQSVATTA
jgi:hypothetical protein